MGLDPTARESNIRDSVKKYFIDNLKGNHGVELIFDTSMANPNVRNKTLDQWVSVRIGGSDRDLVSDMLLTFHCSQRKDNEEHKLSQLVDKVVNLLTTGIPFYQSSTNPWTSIGYLLTYDIIISETFSAQDETKYKIINAPMKWATKL